MPFIYLIFWVLSSRVARRGDIDLSDTELNFSIVGERTAYTHSKKNHNSNKKWCQFNEFASYFSISNHVKWFHSSQFFNQISFHNIVAWTLMSLIFWIKLSNIDLWSHSLFCFQISLLSNISSMAILLDYGFFEAYAGESKDGHSAAKFSSGDTISINCMLPNSDDLNDLSYATSSLLNSCFLKMGGVTAGVCFRCFDRPKVASLHIWKSLHSCYSWLLQTDYRKTVSPYLDHVSMDAKYDVFRVVYISNEDIFNARFFPHHMLANEEGSDEGEKA